MSVHPSIAIALLGAAALALLAAVVLMTRGMGQRRQAAAFVERAVEASGEVLESRPKDVAISGEPSTIYFQVVRFALPDGSEVTAETMTGMQPPVPRVGDPLEIRYDPDHPRRVAHAGVDHAQGAGATSFALGRLALVLTVALPFAWLVVELVLATI